MLTKGDEYPIHQTPEPIAFSGSDRNFYDRYFFCGAQADGGAYFAVAFGVYPHLNVMDAHFSLLGKDGVQRSIHASRVLDMERMNLSVGPISIEVIEPLQKLRIRLAPTEGMSADIECVGRAFPIQEPRFTRRIGPRMMMDLTRFTQNMRWSGWTEADGVRETYDSATSWGTCDRSWGSRPIGAPDAQPTVPAMAPQFYWLWAPTNFPNLSLFFHVNEDERGQPWNTRAVLASDGVGVDGFVHLEHPHMEVSWAKGRRHAASARLDVADPAGRGHTVTWRPLAHFQMKGIGYGHADWGHGMWKGPLAVAREDFKPADLDPLVPQNLHIQAISEVRHDGPDGLASTGMGILEQLVIGPHAPSGFKSIVDGAE